MSFGEFHKAPFEVLALVCVASVIGVFAGSVMDLELDFWNVWLFASGVAVLVVMLKVFHQLVQLDARFVKTIVKMLRRQRRLNEEAVERKVVDKLSDERAWRCWRLRVGTLCCRRRSWTSTNRSCCWGCSR